MRESNFAFPAQNRACVCITAQLYDRRALDTTSPLPLFNSLTHLTYLTSTSPRIREIMTMDGGLERLVRILHEFCICPPPPENPSILYGLSPPNARPPKLMPTLNPQSFDKHAAYRFSLAFQCVVNIGVRGSEDIRGRVVQAGTLDVVGCILEAWLANKGFAIGPSSSATGMPRETREQRLARRRAQAEQRQAEEAVELARALQRQIAVEHITRLERAVTGSELFQDDEQMVEVSTDIQPPTVLGVIHESPSMIISITPPVSDTPSTTSNDTDADTSTDTSTNATPVRSGTPTGAVLVPGRDRSGTVVARPIWDPPATVPRHRTHRTRQHLTTSPSGSTDTSQPNTETEDDGDVDMDRDRDADETSPSPERHGIQSQRTRRAVGIVSDAPPAAALEVNADAHIIINDAQGGVVGGDGVGVEDGIVLLEPNDDFAMGAPPGAPGAIDEGGPLRRDTVRNRTAPDATPRAGAMDLPMTTVPTPVGRPGRRGQDAAANNTPTATRGAHRNRTGDIAGTNTMAIPIGRTSNHHHHHHRDSDSGPYRDEDVLLSLQLLAYLSKYPHVRQAFYKSRATFHPASVNLPSARPGQQPPVGSSNARTPSVLSKEPHSFFRAFSSATSRGKEKEKVPASSTTTSSSTATTTPIATRHTNVFSLVERFTFRPSSTETDLPNPPPKLPPEIQYWAGVIMRNACRKDESQGGIRQCANMLCGQWESYPREFAKCRRCRKAKYCGKECQSTAWSEGHRFWCSVKEGDEETAEPIDQQANPEVTVAGESGVEPLSGVMMTTGGTMTGRAERRVERERERHARERALATMAPGADATQAARGGAFRNPHNANTTATAPGQQTSRVTATGANRPLLAPPVQPWANRSALPYLRPVDNPDGIGPPPAAPRTAFNLYQGRSPTANADAGHSPGRRRAETMSGVTSGSSMEVLGTSRRLETSRYFSVVHGDDAGPSGRRPGDHDMTT